MTQEKPLVSIGDIAQHLKVSKYLARRTLRKYKVPTFYIGRYLAVYPSTIKKCCEGNFIPDDANSSSNEPEMMSNDAEMIR